ncbi:hypothetical protein [Paraoerskovia sediminicola]|nr:hypothetical protein [Paraoerskovia sediminicola]
MVGLFFWWSVALVAAVAVLVFAGIVTSDNRSESGGGFRELLDEFRSGLRSLFRRPGSRRTADAEAQEKVPARVRRARERTGLGEFLAATEVEQSPYIDPTQITVPVLWARDHAISAKGKALSARDRAREAWHIQRLQRSEADGVWVPVDAPSGDPAPAQDRVALVTDPAAYAAFEHLVIRSDQSAPARGPASLGVVVASASSDADDVVDREDDREEDREDDRDGAASVDEHDEQQVDKQDEQLEERVASPESPGRGDDDHEPALAPVWAPVRRRGTDGPERISA